MQPTKNLCDWECITIPCNPESFFWFLYIVFDLSVLRTNAIHKVIFEEIFNCFLRVICDLVLIVDSDLMLLEFRVF